MLRCPECLAQNSASCVPVERMTIVSVLRMVKTYLYFPDWSLFVCFFSEICYLQAFLSVLYIVCIVCGRVFFLSLCVYASICACVSKTGWASLICNFYLSVAAHTMV